MAKIMINVLTLIILNFIIITYGDETIYSNSLINSLCPPQELLHPCQCQESNRWENQTMIRCGGEELYNFSEIFANLSKSLPNDKKHLKYFYLNNTAVTELSDNFFSDITFEAIIFDNAESLREIQPKTFAKMTKKVKFIYARNTNLSEEYREMYDDGPFSNLENSIQLRIASDAPCPEADRLAPCVCTKEEYKQSPFEIPISMTTINCDNSISNLTEIFEGISNSSSKPVYYDSLIIKNNNQLKELPVNSFGNFQFHTVLIRKCPNLEAIKLDAFGRGSSTIQTLQLTDVSLSPENDTNEKTMETFQALNHLRNLNTLLIQSNLTHVPSHAFDLRQSNLKSIDIFSNDLKSIGSYAFYNLPRLESLILGTDINKISKYSFASRDISNKTLELSLVSNPFNMSSFEFGSFNGHRGPIKLQFSYVSGCKWEMLYLDENVFAPFLDKEGNRIELESECGLICDCKMKWISDSPDYIKEKITLTPYNKLKDKYNGKYVPCANGKSLFEIPKETFEKCA